MRAHRYLILATASGMACWSGVAAAQDTAEQPGATSGDIIVTANRREQRLQDVPLSVTALGSETLRNQNINNLVDIGAGRVPGVTIVPLFGNPAAAIISIRGQTPSDPSQGTKDMPAAFYVDGISFPRAQGLAMDLIAPERIEVLRGPQGQLFGRNAEAGVVQIISRKPSGDWKGDFTIGAGEYSTFTNKALLDLPEVGGFAIQISGFQRRHGGYTHNVSNPLLQDITPYQNPLGHIRLGRGDYDGDFGRMKSYGGRIAVMRDFGNLNAFYSYDNTYVKEVQGLTTFKIDPSCGTLANPSCLNSDDYRATLVTSNGTFYDTPVTEDYPEALRYSVYAPTLTTKTNGHLLNLTYSASDALTLKSITGYRHVTRYGHNSSPMSVSLVLPVSGEYLNSKSFSQELQGQYSTDGFNVTAGAIYFREKVADERDNLFAVNCGILGATLSGPCDPIGQSARGPYYAILTALGVPNVGFRAQSARAKAFAAYAQGTWTPDILDEALELTAGLRYSNGSKRGRRTISGGVELATPIENEVKTDRFDPAVTLKYTFSPQFNIYGRFATGFRDGGSNVRSNTFNAFQTESIKSFEIGFKSQMLDNKVLFNVSAFHNKIKNQQYDLQSDPQNPGVTDTINFPFETTIKGIEAELNLKPFGGLTISTSFTYLDKSNLYFVGIERGSLATYRPNVTFSELTGIVVDDTTKAAHPNSIIYGLAPYGAPKWSGFVAADYEIPASGNSNVLFHVDYTRTNTFFTGGNRYSTAIVNGVATARPSYNSGVSRSRVNARISWRDIEMNGTKLDFSIYADNLFDRVDSAFAYLSGNALNAATPAAHSPQLLMPPRIIGAEARVHF